MNQLKSTYDFSYGTVSTEIRVNGPVRNSELLADHLQSAVMMVLGTQFIQSGLIRETAAQGQIDETFENTFKAGAITLGYTISFSFKRDVSRSTINSIVAGEIVPQFYRVASIHLADEITEQASLTPMPTAVVRDTTGLLVGTARSPRTLSELYAMSEDGQDSLLSSAGKSQQARAH
jgi:hypothetical protein